MMLFGSNLSQEELDNKIKLHEKWLKDDDKGQPLYLYGVECHNLDFSNYNLSQAMFHNVFFINCKFYNTHCVGSSFNTCLLQNSDYTDSDFEYNTFLNCNFVKLNINNTIFSNNIFIHSRLRDMGPAASDYFDSQIPIHCPEEGEFIGFKKAYLKTNSCIAYLQVLVKLKIPADAKRSSGISNKCRCNKAEVLEITDCVGNESYLKAYSGYDPNFKYEVGKIVEVEDFNDNRWNECSTGIHFFLTKDEAIKY